MDKNQNRKKRRSRGEGVTSYRVTSSLTLTDEAYQQQQRAKQQRVVQPEAYGQAQPSSPFDMHGQGSPQAYPGYTQQEPSYNSGYYEPQDPNATQSYYDPPPEGHEQQTYSQSGYEAQQGYQSQQGYDQQTYYDQQTGQAYDSQGYPQQGYDQQYDAQGYYDENGQYVQGQGQGYYDPNQPYDPNQQGYDPQYAQGYYDENGQYVQGYYDPQNPEAQGYYDENGQYVQGYYDPQNPEAQGYYDENGQYVQGYDQQYGQYPQQGYEQQYAEPGYYDQQGYAQQGYEQGYEQGYYDQQGYSGDPNDPYGQGGAQQMPPRKQKIETVSDYYSQMMGEGYVFATDSDDSPHHEQVKTEQAFYQKQQATNSPYPPPHLVPQSPLIQMLGPVADIYLKLRELWVKLSAQATHYTDMFLDLQESMQKELKEAATMAFKGFLDQMKQRSPIALPYQQGGPGQPPNGAPGAPGAPPGHPYGAPAAPQQPPVSFVDLQELNVEFTDNYDQPLFDFSKYAGSQYKVSKQIADPAAMEAALWAIRECAPRAGAIPPAQEGPYANLPLTEVMNNITDHDLMAFLRYVKAYPGNYVSRSLKISETFATWVVYGAPQP